MRIPADIVGVPVDLLVLGGLFGALLLFGLAGGRRFTLPFLFSLYIAYAVSELLPTLGAFLARFNVAVPVTAKAILFVLAAPLFTWFLSGTAATALFRFSLRGIKNWWQVLVGSALGTALSAVLFFELLPSQIHEPSLLLAQWLLVEPFPFLWALAPVAFLALLNARDS